jgi:hypothetical protein
LKDPVLQSLDSDTISFVFSQQITNKEKEEKTKSDDEHPDISKQLDEELEMDL